MWLCLTLILSTLVIELVWIFNLITEDYDLINRLRCWTISKLTKAVRWPNAKIISQQNDYKAYYRHAY